MKKHLANIISFTRIIAGAFLYLFNSINGGFIAIYIICGITDLVDGRVARKLGTTSALGAALDTVGDIVTYMALVKILIMQKMIPFWIVMWMLGVAAIHLIAGIVSLVKVKKFFIVHSLFGKILGGSIFVLPFAMWIISKTQLDYMDSVHFLMAVIAAISTVAGIESLAIQCKEDDPQTEIKTIYRLLKEKNR